MGKKEKAPVIIINEIEHIIEDMTDEQKIIINHINDLDRKLSSAQFNIDQLRVGRSAFVSMISQSVEIKEAA